MKVPISENGQEGLSTCCHAMVTYSTNVCHCKQCWEPIDRIDVFGELSDAIDQYSPNGEDHEKLKAVQITNGF